MSYRCTNAFVSGSSVYGGGVVVKDDDPILKTHAAHFVKVNEPVRGGETASASPSELRTVTPSVEDTKEEVVAAEPAPPTPKKAASPRQPRAPKRPS